MKKILLCVSLLSMFAAGFVGCSQKREWNHEQRKAMREALRSRKVMNMQFGALTSLFTMIPVLNLVILPVAICGATAMWVDCYRDKHAMWR
mgnify:CR=1 FL=1